MPRDLKHFADTTRNHTCIMGRKTYESIIARLGHPLPDRKSVIITRQKDFKADGSLVVASWEEALQKTKGEEVFVSGGSDIYKLALPSAERIYLTRIHMNSDGEVSLPTIDFSEWIKVSEEFHPKDNKNEFDLTFYIYDRKK